MRFIASCLLLLGILAAPALPAVAGDLSAKRGPAEPFSFDAVIDQAKALGSKPYVEPRSRAAETLKEDLDGRGPVRVSDVEAEQKEILKIVRRLVDEGQIVIASGGADEFL